MTIATDIQSLYIAYFNRPADYLGLKYWTAQAEANGGSVAAVANAFSASPEYTAQFAGQSSAQIINTIYLNLFGRPAEPDAIDYWGTRLDNKTFNIGTIANSILVGAQNDDKKTVQNKVAAAEAFYAAMDTSAEIIGYDGPAANGVVKTWLSTVTADPATLEAATNATALNTVLADAAAAHGSTGGTSFTLTTALGEQVNGTAGTDTFNAVLSATAASSTLNVGDLVDGLGGNDTLKVFVDNAATVAMPVGLQVRNVETIDITNGGTLSAAIDASAFAGATTIKQNNTAQAVTNLAATTTAAFQSVTSTGGTAIDVSAAANAAAANVSLNQVKGAGTTNVVTATIKADAANTTLATVNVTGTIAQTTANATAASLDLDVTLGEDVQTATVNSAVKTTLTIDNAGTSTKDLTVVNASGSTGDITYVADSTVTTITTGVGKDTVTLATALNATTKAASVNTGAGDDVINVTAGAAAAVAGGTTVAVNAGEGDDEINLTISANSTYDVKGGAGDDTVVVTGTVKTTDKIDGGEGTDVISLAGKATYVADDYIVLNKVLTNFETLQLTGVAVTNLDASKVAANYTTFDLFTGSTVTGVGTQALIANGDLTAEAAGFKLGTGSAANTYAGTLNITDKGLAGAADAIEARAETVNLTVAGGSDSNVAANNAVLTGEAKAATVTLTAGTDTKGTAATADDVLVASQVTVEQGTTAGTLKDLASLTLSGNGTAIVTVGAAAGDFKLVNVDASALNSVDVKGAAVTGLTYESFNNAAETIKLGGGLDSVTLNASTYGAVDTIDGLKLVLNTNKTALDLTKSDQLIITGFGDLTADGKMTTNQTDLDLALKEAAAFQVNGSDVDVVAFQMGGNTYLFSDKGTAGSVDAADIVVKLVGNIDLDALVVALS